MKKRIKKLLRENLLKEEEPDWGFHEMLDDVKNTLMSDYLSAIKNEKPTEDKPLKARQELNVVPFGVLKRQWEEYMKYGYVLPNYEKTIDYIENLFTKNFCIMYVNTELAGHSSVNPEYEWKEFLEGTEFDNDNLDEFVNYLDYHFGDYILDNNGQWKISDYGLPKIEKLIGELRKTNDATKKLPILDKILNVIHMRSDIAEWFVEGGSNSLSKLAGDIE